MSKYFFSIDDGYPQDLILKDIFIMHQIPAIFYIPIINSEGLPVLKTQEIKEIAKDFTIGSHTFHHLDLTKMSFTKAKEEISTGKIALEDIIGQPVTDFAPPRGHYNQHIVDYCHSIGITSFRSARLLNFHPSKKSDQIWHPNLHFYPHCTLVDILHCLKQQDLLSLFNRIKNISSNHLELIPSLLKSNNIVHIWGHSWEIPINNLENILHHARKNN